MLILQKDISPHSTLVVWQAVESTAELERLVPADEIEQAAPELTRLEKRKREWLCTRILLNTIARDAKLSFLPNGKPVLSGNWHISISHSNDLASMIVSTNPVGLDVQGVDEKLLRIEKRFTNASETRFLPDDHRRIDFLTVIWSAKEAVFKYYGELVNFSADISVLPFEPTQEIIHADYVGHHGSRRFDLYHFRLSDHHFVITM